MVQDEANASIADFGFRIGNGLPAQQRIAQNEPNPLAAGYPSIPIVPVFHHSNPKSIVRNEANSGGWADWEIGVPDGQARQTKPIHSA